MEYGKIPPVRFNNGDCFCVDNSEIAQMNLSNSIHRFFFSTGKRIDFIPGSYRREGIGRPYRSMHGAVSLLIELKTLAAEVLDRLKVFRIAGSI